MVKLFKVYAGNMFVGELTVKGNQHLFTDTLGRLQLNNGVSERVQSYKKLRLERLA